MARSKAGGLFKASFFCLQWAVGAITGSECLLPLTLRDFDLKKRDIL